MSLFKTYVLKNRNNKFTYYFKGVIRDLLPSASDKASLKQKLNAVKRFDISYLSKRLGYYNKLSASYSLPDTSITLASLKRPKRGTVYYFDTVEYTRYFDNNLRANFLFGDIIHVPSEPSIVKSRPIEGDCTNSVILKLEKLRHFNFLKDSRPFEKKMDKLIWRGVVGVGVEHRARFMRMYFGNPLFDLGKINSTGQNDEWLSPKISINKHLLYKFIFCIEGNDVATNLKWVMSSGSVAVMPKPRYETWFMEGTLIPNYHYIQVKDDFSDAEERIQYYIDRPAETKQIVRNANEYVNQFKNKEREDLLSLLVLEKYFVKTGQLDPISPLARGVME